MKKTHRAVLSILLVLTLLATLPLTAMAESIGDNTTTVDPPRDVENGQEMQNNTGTIGTNKGTVTNNGVQPAEEKPADPSSGTVNSNGYGGTIQNNYGTVVQNGASSGSPTINNNYGLVLENYGDGKVNTNQPGGVVEKNHGGGTVWNNYGQVDNNADGYVMNNKDGGVVYNDGGTVDTNEEGGVVFNKSGTVIRNASAGKGEYAGVINNGGTVKTNQVGGVVDNYKGTVEHNQGKVVYNGIEGKVTNVEKGTVEYNLGTVVDTDGKIYYGLHGWYKDEDNVDTEHILGSYKEGEGIDLDQKVAEITREGFKLNKYEIQVYQNGKFSDYTPNGEVAARANVDAGDGGGDGEGEAAKPLYRISAPTRLKLFWEKIVTAVAPSASSGGGEAVPSSYNPKYIGLGSVIFINEKGYKVVEIKDDAYVVVSFDALPDEDVQDLDALYAKLFTPEQQKLIKNVGQLLDSEDVLTVFGTPGNHPVYEISKDLVK
ncbi:MAG: hypothetical protein MSH58_10330 [Clostridiales bacterium]|nr:hypothetical protein [Clostridiales bacterium]